MVLIRDLEAAIKRLNPDLPPDARADALAKLTKHYSSRSLIQHNREFYKFMRDGVPVEWRDSNGNRTHVLIGQQGLKNSGSP